MPTVGRTPHHGSECSAPLTYGVGVQTLRQRHPRPWGTAAAALLAAVALLAGAVATAPAQAAGRMDSHRPTAEMRVATFPLTADARGSRVLRLQQQLVWLGYDIDRRELQEARYGATTAKAVQRMQVKFFWSIDRTPGRRAIDRIAGIAGTIGALPKQCQRSGIVLCIDKTQKLLRYVRDGEVLRTTDVRFGVPGKDTPEGTFSVWMLWEDATSGINGPDEPRAPMPYAIFFDGDIAVHYSPMFAAYGYYPGGGSHGCVNVASKEDSIWIFERTPTGTPVHVYSS